MIWDGGGLNHLFGGSDMGGLICGIMKKVRACTGTVDDERVEKSNGGYVDVCYRSVKDL